MSNETMLVGQPTTPRLDCALSSPGLEEPDTVQGDVHYRCSIRERCPNTVDGTVACVPDSGLQACVRYAHGGGGERPELAFARCEQKSPGWPQAFCAISAILASTASPSPKSETGFLRHIYIHFWLPLLLLVNGQNTSFRLIVPVDEQRMLRLRSDGTM